SPSPLRTPPPVIEPILQLLPTEPHKEPSAVILEAVMFIMLFISQTLDAGELISACRNIQFLSAHTFTFLSGVLYMDISRDMIGMMRGPESRLCWFESAETHCLTREGFPFHNNCEDSFPGIQVIEPILQLLPTEPHEEPSAVILVSCTFLHVAKDGQVNTSTWEQEQVDSPHSDSEEQYDSEESEERLNPEELEVPFICCHLSDRGVTEIGLKVPALREAFATLLASIHNQNFLFMAGKKIVMRLAAANNQDAVGVQLAYEALIRFLRTPSNQESIKAELSSCVYHYNFVDIFFELLLFGYFTNSSIPETFTGGFLERLLALFSMWDVDVWEPAAELYFTVLI
ncbi:hypothetical protein KOW79_000071, partial [Hemibagrus wyckioides]